MKRKSRFNTDADRASSPSGVPRAFSPPAKSFSGFVSISNTNVDRRSIKAALADTDILTDEPYSHGMQLGIQAVLRESLVPNGPNTTQLLDRENANTSTNKKMTNRESKAVQDRANFEAPENSDNDLALDLGSPIRKTRATSKGEAYILPKSVEWGEYKFIRANRFRIPETQQYHYAIVMTRASNKDKGCCKSYRPEEVALRQKKAFENLKLVAGKLAVAGVVVSLLYDAEQVCLKDHFVLLCKASARAMADMQKDVEFNRWIHRHTLKQDKRKDSAVISKADLLQNVELILYRAGVLEGKDGVLSILPLECFEFQKAFMQVFMKKMNVFKVFWHLIAKNAIVLEVVQVSKDFGLKTGHVVVQVGSYTRNLAVRGGAAIKRRVSEAGNYISRNSIGDRDQKSTSAHIDLQLSPDSVSRKTEIEMRTFSEKTVEIEQETMAACPEIVIDEVELDDLSDTSVVTSSSSSVSIVDNVRARRKARENNKKLTLSEKDVTTLNPKEIYGMDSDVFVYELRRHYGEKVAFYFAYIHNYTKFLMLPAVLGVVVSFSSYYSPRLYGQCMTLFGCCMCFIWAPLWLKYWLRKNNELCLVWDANLEEFDHDNRDYDPKYSGICSKGYWSNRCYPKDMAQLHDEDSDEEDSESMDNGMTFRDRLPVFLIQAVFIFVCWVMMNVLVVLMVQLYLNFKTVRTCQPNDLREDMCFTAFTRWFAILLQGIVLGLIIDVWLLAGLKMMAAYFCSLENHRTEESFEQFYIWKVFMYDWGSMYFWFFCLAFIYVPFGKEVVDVLESYELTRPLAYDHSKSNFDLGEAFITPLIVTQFLNFLLDTLVPYLLNKLFHRRRKRKILAPEEQTGQSRRAEKEAGELSAHVKNVLADNMIMSGECARVNPVANCGQGQQKFFDVIRSSELSPYSANSDYNDMVMQYGYVVMFSVVWSWIPFCALLNNIIEIRGDVFTMFYSRRRPLPRKANGIGTWLKCIKVVSYIAIVVNMTLICLSTGHLEWWFNDCHVYYGIACRRESMELVGTPLATFSNLSSAQQCMDKCRDSNICSNWTYWDFPKSTTYQQCRIFNVSTNVSNIETVSGPKEFKCEGERYGPDFSPTCFKHWSQRFAFGFIFEHIGILLFVFVLGMLADAPRWVRNRVEHVQKQAIAIARQAVVNAGTDRIASANTRADVRRRYSS